MEKFPITHTHKTVVIIIGELDQFFTAEAALHTKCGGALRGAHRNKAQWDPQKQQLHLNKLDLIVKNN